MVDLFMLEIKKKYNHKAEEIYCVRTSEELKSFTGLHSLLSFSLPHWHIPRWTYTSSLGHLPILPTQKALHNYLAFYHGNSRL